MNNWQGKWQPHNASVNNKYNEVLHTFLIDDDAWKSFKTYPVYNGIVGNDSQSTEVAAAYLEGLRVLSPSIYDELHILAENDKVGHPIVHAFPDLPPISAGTIMYAYTLADIERHFGPLDAQSSILEIGAGYGGQMVVALLHQQIEKYSVIDLPLAITVIQKYMQYFKTQRDLTQVSYYDIDYLPLDRYGLVVSNFCLTELDDEGIDSYIDSVFVNCRNCYIQSNFKATKALEKRDLGREERLVSRLEELFAEVLVLPYAEGFSEWTVNSIIGKGRK
jgi:hypothetical protein